MTPRRVRSRASLPSLRITSVLIITLLFTLMVVLMQHGRWHAIATTVPEAVTVPVQIVRSPLSSSTSLVVAMVTAHRQGHVSYLSRTLQSLYCALNASGEQPSSWPAVLVINTEVPSSRHATFAQQLSAPGFSSYFHHGLTVLNMTALHPQLHTPEYVLQLAARTSGNNREGEAATSSTAGAAPSMVQAAAGDSADRLWWRSKEVLDTAYALEAGLQAAPFAQHVLFLQDDIQLAGNLLQQLQGAINNQPSKDADVISLFAERKVVSTAVIKDPWAVHVGAVALAFRRAVAQELIPYLRHSFADLPVDWLLSAFLQSRNKTLWVMQPSLVQHVGVSSSLVGKKQSVVSATFTDHTCWFESS